MIPANKKYTLHATIHCSTSPTKADLTTFNFRNKVQVLSRTKAVFKEFPGLENET